MLEAVLTLLAAAWGAAIHQLVPADQQLAVGVLAFITIAAAYLCQNKNRELSAIGPAVDAAKVVKRPYPTYDISTPEAKKASFKSIIPVLIDEACEELEQSYEVRPDEVAGIRKVLDYNVTGGKMNRGLMVVESGILLFGGKATNDDLCRFAVLGWVIEMLQAWLLIADDIMDSSVTRRGQPCWYKVDGLGSAAINDAFLVEMLLFKALRRHFGDRPEYSRLVDLVMETTLQTELGQLLDIKCDTAPLSAFTLDRWTAIVKYKTAFYSFYLPVAMAMVCVRGRVLCTLPRWRAIAAPTIASRPAGRHRGPQRVRRRAGNFGRDGRLLPSPGRLPRRLRHVRTNRQARHGHPR